VQTEELRTLLNDLRVSRRAITMLPGLSAAAYNVLVSAGVMKVFNVDAFLLPMEFSTLVIIAELGDGAGSEAVAIQVQHQTSA
jgi:hypothetical protein